MYGHTLFHVLSFSFTTRYFSCPFFLARIDYYIFSYVYSSFFRRHIPLVRIITARDYTSKYCASDVAEFDAIFSAGGILFSYSLRSCIRAN